MPKPQIELYQWEFSPYCRKVRYALALKGLAYGKVEVGSRLGLVKRLNPGGKLPVLIHDGVKVIESADICEFIEKHHPEPSLYPSNRRLLGRTRIIEAWAGDSLYPLIRHFLWLDDENFGRYLASIKKDTSEFLRLGMRIHTRRQTRRDLRGHPSIGGHSSSELRERLRRQLNALNDMLWRSEKSMESADWLVGDAISIADVTICAMFDSLMITREAQEVAAPPLVNSWYKRAKAAIDEAISKAPKPENIKQRGFFEDDEDDAGEPGAAS